MNFLGSLKKKAPKLPITSHSISSRTIFTDIGSNVQLRQSSGKSNTFSILCGTHINLLVFLAPSLKMLKKIKNHKKFKRTKLKVWIPLIAEVIYPNYLLLSGTRPVRSAELRYVTYRANY